MVTLHKGEPSAPRSRKMFCSESNTAQSEELVGGTPEPGRLHPGGQMCACVSAHKPAFLRVYAVPGPWNFVFG